MDEKINSYEIEKKNFNDSIFDIAITMSEQIYKEASTVSESMQKYGCDFEQTLGVLISKSSIENIVKIKIAFCDEWDDHLSGGKK